MHKGERMPCIWIFNENIRSSASFVISEPVLRLKQLDTGHTRRKFLQGDVL